MDSSYQECESMVKNILLQIELENMFRDNKIKNTKYSQRYFLKEYLKTCDLTLPIKLQDIISYCSFQRFQIKGKDFSDRKRSHATFFNETTYGYWDYMTKNGEKYYIFNPELRFTIEKKTFGSLFTNKIKKLLLKRACNMCEICGSRGSNKTLHADHFLNRSDGGNGTYENGVILCQNCNNKKKDKSLEKMVLDYVKIIISLKNRSGENDTVKEMLTRCSNMC
jgi:5-methylcytosine-specific restriction endonuclease McrA